MAQSAASPHQLRYIEGITKNSGLRPPKIVLDSKSATGSWITIALHVLTENEDAKLGGKTREKQSKSKIASSLQELANVVEISAPDSEEILAIRTWLEELPKAFSIPSSDKMLKYWNRALLYRDLNALASESEPPITSRLLPEKLAAGLPKLKADFEPPRTSFPEEPVALLIAYVASGNGNATVLLGIPLAYERQSGDLIPPPQGVAPFFNREWLEPPDPDATKDAYFGSVPDCDEFFSNNPPAKNSSWPDYWGYVESFVQAITGTSNSLPNLAPIIGKRDTVWKIVKWDTGGASKRIADTYQRALTKSPPLLAAVCDKQKTPRTQDLAATLQASNVLLGHIDTFDAKKAKREGFSLERSQRIAATAMTQVGHGELLAVNGPPGTGKTSFLRAVIGTEYVQAALQGKTPLMILATAATNKAVTNIIESFAGIAGPEMLPDWSSRWLPHLPSYGWFYPAASKSDADLEGFMVLKRDGGKDGQPLRLNMTIAAGKFSSVVEQQRNWMLDTYLDLHRQVFGLQQKVGSADAAAQMIHRSLVYSVGRMHGMQILFQQCIEYPIRNEGCRQSMTEWHQTIALHTDAQNHWLQESEQLIGALRKWNDIRLTLRESINLRNKQERWRYRIWSFFFGDKAGEQAQVLESTAARQMASLDPTVSVYRKDTLEVAERQHALVAKMLSETKSQIRIEEEKAESARTKLGHWLEWHSLLEKLAVGLGNDGNALQQSMVEWAESGFPSDHQLHLQFEESLDKAFRFRHFHMAARYWEARWLADTPAPKDAGDMHLALQRAAMLAPVIVATVYTLPGILDEFEFADLLIFDEAGQASPEIGGASFAFAKRAIVVGDIYQLKPIWNVGKEADARLRRDLEIAELPEEFCVSAGSIMKVAQHHTSLVDKESGRLGPGIGLVAHYRCRAEIIEYCRRLIYRDGLAPLRVERPPNGQRNFLYPPMAWVAVKRNVSAQKQGGSWINVDQIKEIVRWLEHDGQRIIEHYGVARISDAVALIAPFRAQALALRKAVAELLGDEEAQAMIINTVHALQGAEKPIIAFSLTQDEGGFFVNRDGPNLLNVAVSRAKDCFILFAAPNVLQPVMDAKAAYSARSTSNEEPLAVLVAYMNEAGRRLYPREVVIIEAPGKANRISEALGLSAQVIATGGHFRRIVLADGQLQAEVIENGESTVRSLQEVSSDLRQIDAFYLATDDDDDGEEIAWHVQEILRTQGVIDPERIRRMRFYSLTQGDIRKAREQALSGIDARRVRANILRSLFERELHQHLVKAGVHASRPQLALLREIAERQQESGYWRVKVNGDVGGTPFFGYLLDKQAILPAQYTNGIAAQKVADATPVGAAASSAERVCRQIMLPRYPASTTSQTIIAAYKRYKWMPKRTTEALNALYLGHSAPTAYGVGCDEDKAASSGVKS